MVSELKALMAAELASRYTAGTDYLVVGYTGLKGPETAELRAKLRAKKARMEVVKNSIVRRVLEAEGLGDGVQFLDGPSALVTAEGELPALCKLIVGLSKEYEGRLAVRGGLYEGSALDAAGVKRLADIPPLPVLQAQFIGGVQAQIAAVASAFQSIARSLACALEEIRKQKEAQAG